MEQDPLSYVNGANLYQMELSDPVDGLDPFGLVDWTWWGNFASGLPGAYVDTLKNGQQADALTGFWNSFTNGISGGHGSHYNPQYGHQKDYDNGSKVGKYGAEAEDVATLAAGAKGGLSAANRARKAISAANATRKAAAVCKTAPGIVERLAAESEGIVAQNGTKVTGFTKHGVDRAVGDAAQRAGTTPQAILDALKNPQKIVNGVDSQGRPFQIFTGQDARVVVNPQTGQVISVNPLSGAGAH